MEEDTHPLIAIGESDTEPMSLGMYMQLSNVSGFKQSNGETYNAYIPRWMERRGVEIDPRSPNFNIIQEKLEKISRTQLSNYALATVEDDTSSTSEYADDCTQIIDGNLLRVLVDKIKTDRGCMVDFKYKSRGTWTSGNVTITLHPDVMDILEWGAVVRSGTILSYAADQFNTWSAKWHQCMERDLNP